MITIYADFNHRDGDFLSLSVKQELAAEKERERQRQVQLEKERSKSRSGGKGRFPRDDDGPFGWRR